MAKQAPRFINHGFAPPRFPAPFIKHAYKNGQLDQVDNTIFLLRLFIYIICKFSSKLYTSRHSNKTICIKQYYIRKTEQEMGLNPYQATKNSQLPHHCLR
ncbi:hypothetical protein CIPAW_13G023200 [Carya illinoinensis]|uniref:Uncharacterized protein n=1 Tax=Carya illinoinensis TaxID=32201 RepID=A0A8T1NNQ3_CARIL|nr:hypothetical protein CIPAW_13G023200 [Carya illinoinensis]